MAERQQDLFMLDASKLTPEQRSRLSAELRRIQAREFSSSQLTIRQADLSAEQRKVQSTAMVKIDTAGLTPLQKDVLGKKLKDIVRGLAPGSGYTGGDVYQHLSHTDTDGWF